MKINKISIVGTRYSLALTATNCFALYVNWFRLPESIYRYPNWAIVDDWILFLGEHIKFSISIDFHERHALSGKQRSHFHFSSCHLQLSDFISVFVFLLSFLHLAEMKRTSLSILCPFGVSLSQRRRWDAKRRLTDDKWIEIESFCSTFGKRRNAAPSSSIVTPEIHCEP